MMLQAIAEAMPVSTELPSLITTSAMTVAIIQWLKNTKLIPFINENSSAINRVVGWVAAFISAAGLHYSWDAATGTLQITNIHLMSILHGLGDVTKSYAFQWLIYKGVISVPSKGAANG